MPGCEVELHGVEAYELEGCLVALGLFVVVFKRCLCCKGRSMKTKQFVSDCIKLLAGASCVYAAKLLHGDLQQLSGFDVGPEDGGSCVWHSMEAVADATLGPLVVFVIFGLVRNLTLLCCRCESCAGLPNLLTPGACTLDNRCARFTFLVQLVLWAAVVLCAKVLTLVAMESSLAQEKLIPLLHAQLKPLLDSSPRSLRLQRLVAVVIVPAVATSFQFVFFDCIFVHFARKAPQRALGASREPLLQGGAAQHPATHSGAEGGSRAEPTDDWGQQYAPARVHIPQDRAEGEDPEDLGGAKCGCVANLKQLKNGAKSRLVSITQPGRDPV
jgi:hypothetical protein